jgi:hypothetical protein
VLAVDQHPLADVPHAGVVEFARSAVAVWDRAGGVWGVVRAGSVWDVGVLADVFYVAV